MNRLIYTLSICLVAGLAFASCEDWTEPEHKDFHHKTQEQTDPDGYAARLSAVREYKKTDHKVMFVTIEGTATHPSSQNQHLMAVPDSVDYVCVQMSGDGLHANIASEISEVREKKGTETLLFVDYAVISEAWGLLEDARADAGQAAGTLDEARQYFKEQTELQLARCTKYGFSGLMVSFVGNISTDFNKTSQEAFIQAVKDFYAANPDLTVVFRGSARNVVDTEFLKQCKYLVIVAGEEKKLTVLVNRILGSSAPKDRVIMEHTVPSTDSPEQKGSSLAEGAKWVVDESDNTSFTPCGLGVSNAYDDYFNKTMDYYNVRTAISIMNPVAETPAEGEATE